MEGGRKGGWVKGRPEGNKGTEGTCVCGPLAMRCFMRHVLLCSVNAVQVTQHRWPCPKVPAFVKHARFKSLTLSKRLYSYGYIVMTM